MAQRAGQVGYRGVGGDDQIERLHERGGGGEIGQLRGVIDNAELSRLACQRTDLQ